MMVHGNSKTNKVMHVDFQSSMKITKGLQLWQDWTKMQLILKSRFFFLFLNTRKKIDFLPLINDNKLRILIIIIPYREWFRNYFNINQSTAQKKLLKKQHSTFGISRIQYFLRMSEIEEYVPRTALAMPNATIDILATI